LVKTYSQKFDKKSEKYIFISYSPESKAYKLCNPFSGKITISRDMIFQEAASWDWSGKQVQQGIPVEVPSIDKPESTSASSPTTSPNKNSSPAAFEEHSGTPLFRRSTRNRKLNHHYVDYNTSCIFASFVTDSIFFKEARKESEWCKAMEESC